MITKRLNLSRPGKLPVLSRYFGGLFTKKFGLIFKGSVASAPTHSQRYLHARPSASFMFCARDFCFSQCEKHLNFNFLY